MRPVDHVSDRVDRVIGFFSSSPNWDPPPLPQASVFPPFWFRVGEGTVASGRGGAQWGRGDRHCGTRGKYVFCDDVNLNKRLSSGETTEPYDYAAVRSSLFMSRAGGALRGITALRPLLLTEMSMLKRMPYWKTRTIALPTYGRAKSPFYRGWVILPPSLPPLRPFI
jgi:hypothetical protein